MSWLGDSFTSLTGHLSTLTKEVLSEGREEVGDYLTELNVANQCIQDLEGQCGVNKQELERMRKANIELEERCQAAELQINSISSQYRLLLQNKEDEINRLKRQWQHGEGEITPPPLSRPTGGPERGYGYHSDDADIVDLISSQQEINKLAAEVRRLRSERDHWRLLAGGRTAPIPESLGDSEIQDSSLNGYEKTKIQYSVEELEKRLQETIDEHQNQLTVLQDHYTSQLFKQQEYYQKEIALLNERLNQDRQYDSETEGKDAEPGDDKIQQEYMEEEKELEKSKKEIEYMKHREREKDRQLCLLTHQLEKLQAEKLKLEDSLETTHTALSDLQVQLAEAKNKYEKLLEETAIKTVTGKRLTFQKIKDSDLPQTSTEIEVAHRRIEELEEEKEKASTSEILDDIQAARKRVNDETISSRIRLLHEKEDLVDHMQQVNEMKLDIQNQLNSLQKRNLLLTSDIKKMIDSLGNSENQEFADIVESLNTEKDLLKAYNEDLYSCLQQLDGNSSRSYYEGISENDQDTSNHLREISLNNNEQNKCNENSMQASVSLDDFDQMSLTSSMSELSIRNRELDIQVKGLQQQIETYEREIEHFEFVRADWQTERQAMEDLLLNLRAKLRMKEESLSIAMAEKGLIAVKKKYPEDTQVSSPPEESEDLDGDKMLEKVEQQIEELTQSNAQLESEKEVLWVERNSLLEEVSTLRNLNQTLTAQLNEMVENNIEEEDKNSSREELAFSLEETLVEKETEILGLIHEKQFLEESLDQLDQQHQEAMAEVLTLKENLTKTNKQLQQEICELKIVVTTKEEENSLLKTEVETIQEQLTAVISGSASGPKSNSDTMNNVFFHQPCTSENNIQPFAEIHSAEKDHTTTKRETMKSIVDAFHTINSDNVHLEEEILTIEESRKQLEIQVEEMQQRNEKLLLENKKLSVELESWKKVKDESFKLENDKKYIKEELISTYFTQASQTETVNMDAEKYVGTITELQCNLDSSEKQIENLSIQIFMLRNEKEMLEKELKDIIIVHNGESAKLNNKVNKTHNKYIAVLDETLEKENEQNYKDYTNAKFAGENKVEISTEVFEGKQFNKNNITKKDLEHTNQNSSENSLAAAESKCNKRQNDFPEEMAVIESNIVVQELHFAQNKLLMCDKQSQTTTQFDNTHDQNIPTTLSKNELLSNDQKCANIENELLEFNRITNNSNFKENSEQSEGFKAMSNNSTENNFKRTKSIGNSNGLNDNNTYSNECGSTPNNDSKTIRRLGNTVREQKQEIEVLKTKLTSSSNAIHQKSGSNISIQDSVNKCKIMEEKVHQLEIEKEQMLSVMNEKSRECGNLKNEVYRLVNVVSAEKQALSKMQQDNQELLKQKEIPDQEMTKEAVQNLCRLVRDKDLEIEALGWKNDTLLAVIQQSSPDTSYIEEVLKEQETLMKQLGAYKSDREQIINALSQKHQESLNYHAEVQRLNSLLSAATSKLDMLQHHHESVSQQYEEKQKSLVNTQNEVISLKQRVSDLERQQMELEQKHSEIIESRKSNIMANITKEDLNNQVEKIEKLQNLVKEKEKWIFEKDQLIHELSQDLQKQLANLKQKENEISILQRQTENLVMHLKDTKDDLNVAKEEDQNAKQQLGNVQSEVALMKELNERLNMTVHEKEFEIKALQEKISTLMLMVQEESYKDDVQRILTESDAMQQKAQRFHHERDEALLALSQRQQETEELKIEVQRLKDRESRLNNELERLREHLLQVEESYTKEALNAEEREKQLRNRLNEAEEHARMSSTAIYNANQLANSQVDSLQEQLVLIARQRDKALNQVSEYEDQVQQYSASLGNLQLVLEQFQKERERDILSMKKQHQLELSREKQKIQELIAEVWQKEEQLAEATEAIDAASRLSEQLDNKEEIIATLKEEVSLLTTVLQKSQDEVRHLQTNTEGKVDRQVMKNLVLGYFSASLGQKPDVIRLLARILDFNQEEMSKAGIRIGRENVTERNIPSKKSSGWISSWFGKADSQKPSKQSITAKEKAKEEGNKSFSALFVQFLQNESQPQHNISLPAEEMAREMTMKSTHIKPPRINPFNPLPQRSASVTPPSSPNKNTANLEHPLIRPLSSSLPTFTPILVASDISAATSNSFLQEVLK